MRAFTCSFPKGDVFYIFEKEQFSTWPNQYLLVRVYNKMTKVVAPQLAYFQCLKEDSLEGKKSLAPIVLNISLLAPSTYKIGSTADLALIPIPALWVKTAAAALCALCNRAQKYHRIKRALLRDGNISSYNI